MQKDRNNKQKRIGIHALYGKDPEDADRLLWGRRGFVKKSVLTAMGAALGAPVVFGRYFPAGLIPAGLAHSEIPFQIPGKHPDLVILNDRPVNAETPPHLLDDLVTPYELFFVRNNGVPPRESTIDLPNWTLTVEGESAQRSMSFSLDDLKQNFPTHSYQLTLECGGNGRSEFNPPAKGNQWSTGAIGCAEWTGVRLRDVLNKVGVKPDAVYIGYYGRDTHISGDTSKVVISRGIPIAKAMEEETLIAWAMNGQDLPLHNGYPLRLVVGGWPASCSGKWLSRIVVRNQVHDGPKMTGQSYRVPCKPVAPGTAVPDNEMCIIESMPVKSLITFPKTGASLRLSQELPIRGHAWAGDRKVANMEYSIDFGQTWLPCQLESPANRLAWQHFSASIRFPTTGYYEVWARATDDQGLAQPMVLPGWNPRGYLNNACHRIAIKVV